jgi:hypothetical protein
MVVADSALKMGVAAKTPNGSPEALSASVAAHM